MLEPDLYLQKPLEDYVDHIERLNPRSIPLLREKCTPSVSFQDPYFHEHGADEYEKILLRRFKLYPKARYKVSDFVWGRRLNTAYFFWSFYFTAQKSTLLARATQEQIMEGMTELTINPSGEIVSHTEFWGKHDTFNVKAYKKG